MFFKGNWFYDKHNNTFVTVVGIGKNYLCFVEEMDEKNKLNVVDTRLFTYNELQNLDYMGFNNHE